MGKLLTGVFDSLAGGLNEAAAENLQPNELAICNDMHADGPSLSSREGKEFFAGPYTEEILSVFRYAPGFDDEQTILVGTESSMARVVGTTIVPIEVADGRIYQTSVYRWWGAQYKDEFFAAQRNNGGVKRIFGASIMEAGLDAPTSPPTATDGGPGKKVAGDYQLAYRYYNTVTGARSNWSPVSTVVTIADNRQIFMSSIGISSNPQVNARQIGATKPGGGILYLVGQINDNSSTTFNENALDPEEYGEADIDAGGNVTTDIRNLPPQSQAWALTIHKERLFVLNGDGLTWSEAGLPQSFKAVNFIPVQKGTGLFSWDQHGLVIASELKVEILQGDTPSDWRKEDLSQQHRCPAGKSMAVGDGTLFWYTGTNIVASSGGAPAILPRIERIRTTLDSIPNALKYDVIGETIPSKGWYVLSVPTDDGRKVIVYDYVRSAFAVFPDGPKTIALLFGSDGQEAVYAAFDDDFNLYEYLTGATDAGESITSRFRTSKIGGNGSVRTARYIEIHGPAVNRTATIRIYGDDVLITTRTGVSLNSSLPKRFVIQGSVRPAEYLQVEIESAGTARWRIDKMLVGYVESKRQVVAA